MAAAWSGAEPGGSTDIYLSVSTRRRREVFSAPVRVNRTPGEARVNGEQPPRVALVPRSAGPPALVVVWTAKGDGRHCRCSRARSDDGGRTFGRRRACPGHRRPGESRLGGHRRRSRRHGARGVAGPPSPRSRTRKSRARHRHGGIAPTSASRQRRAMAQFSDLYFATLEGPARRMPLTAGVCYCCKTALAVGLGRKHPSGLAARLSGQPSRYRVRDASRGGDRGRDRSVSAKIAGCSRAAPTMGRRWAPKNAAGCTSSGRPS